jgi:hypothetical protein
MTTISNEPTRVAPDTRRWIEFVAREMWASLAITMMWLAVLFDALFGPDIVNSTPGGTSSTIPSGVVLAFFAFLGTWVVARYGLRHASKSD